jgi:hypothetical protein
LALCVRLHPRSSAELTHQQAFVDYAANDAIGSPGPINLLAQLIIAGPASTSAYWFATKESQAVKRAALRQDKKLG